MTNNPVIIVLEALQFGVMNMPTRQFQNQVGGQTVVCQSDTSHPTFRHCIDIYKTLSRFLS